jgi:hypothetical protein
MNYKNLKPHKITLEDSLTMYREVQAFGGDTNINVKMSLNLDKPG